MVMCAFGLFNDADSISDYTWSVRVASRYMNDELKRIWKDVCTTVIIIGFRQGHIQNTGH
jgi:FKBP-type peptidyl-prolyl cis-trans isomerase (trigger factor)